MIEPDTPPGEGWEKSEERRYPSPLTESLMRKIASSWTEDRFDGFPAVTKFRYTTKEAKDWQYYIVETPEWVLTMAVKDWPFNDEVYFRMVGDIDAYEEWCDNFSYYSRHNLRP